MSSYRNHHYVPQWHQYNFLKHLGIKNFHVLDLSPIFLSLPNGSVKRLSEFRVSGPSGCFLEKDLYTTFFPTGINTDIESRFFGGVDQYAPAALDAILNFTHEDFDPDSFENFMRHLSLQRMRTPKGLSNLQRRLNLLEDNQVLFHMQKLQEIFCAIWSDCIWQIASAENCETKFILSDSPITLYNRAYTPNSFVCISNGDPAVAQNGTHMIYPLSNDKILILTHAAYVRNPWLNPKDIIPNPKPFRDSIFSFMDIQLRSLNETEVKEINHIIKCRASRYVVATDKRWLFPENEIPSTDWARLGGGDLLMPDPRGHTYTSQTTLGYTGGYMRNFDSNNIRPGQPGFTAKPNAEELERFGAFQSFFAERHGPKRRGRAHSFGRLDNKFDSDEFYQYEIKKIPNYLKQFGKPPFYR